MDPESKRLLEQNLTLAKENNHMLRAMRRNMWYGIIWRVIVWTVFILLPLYFYQEYLSPTVQRFQSFGSGNATTTSGGMFGFPSFAEIQKLLDSYQTKQ